MIVQVSGWPDCQKCLECVHHSLIEGEDVYTICWADWTPGEHCPFESSVESRASGAKN